MSVGSNGLLHLTLCFGSDCTTITGTMHEDLQAFLSAKVIGWGIPSQSSNHVAIPGESSTVASKLK
jgi:hypothetical protein